MWLDAHGEYRGLFFARLRCLPVKLPHAASVCANFADSRHSPSQFQLPAHLSCKAGSRCVESRPNRARQRKGSPPGLAGTCDNDFQAPLCTCMCSGVFYVVERNWCACAALCSHAIAFHQKTGPRRPDLCLTTVNTFLPIKRCT